MARGRRPELDARKAGEPPGVSVSRRMRAMASVASWAVVVIAALAAPALAAAPARGPAPPGPSSNAAPPPAAEKVAPPSIPVPEVARRGDEATKLLREFDALL